MDFGPKIQNPIPKLPPNVPYIIKKWFQVKKVKNFLLVPKTSQRLGFGQNWPNLKIFERHENFFLNSQITLSMCLVYDPNIIGLFAISLDLSQFVVFTAKQPENCFPHFLTNASSMTTTNRCQSTTK